MGGAFWNGGWSMKHWLSKVVQDCPPLTWYVRPKIGTRDFPLVLLIGNNVCWNGSKIWENGLWRHKDRLDAIKYDSKQRVQTYYYRLEKLFYSWEYLDAWDRGWDFWPIWDLR